LPSGEDWIPSGAKAKANANLAAIRLLKRLEAEKRNPTPDEKSVLAKYVGWGGLKQVFDTGKEAYRTRPPWNSEQQREYDAWEKQWGKLYDEVKAELTEDEWERARASILNAHYTSRTVINGLWQAVQRLGFTGGKVLETSAGIGHFIGLQPAALREVSRWQAVELDTVSGRILAKLYPQANVQVTGFQDARIPVNSVDLIVGNVPFAKDGPTDKRYPNLSLHNYFFARGLDLLKPGGLMVAITSDSTMDGGASRKAREFFAERADLVGAIRLPNTAFKENAGTEVTTDILIFRKRDGTPFAGQPFINTTEAKTYKGEPIEINEYFAAHPEMMLGRMSKEGTMYAGEMNALLPTPGAELSQQLTEAVAKLPTDAFGAQATPDQQRAPEQSTSYKPGSLVMQDGKPYLANSDGSLTAPDWAGNAKAVKQAKSYIGVRDATRALIVKQLDPDATPEAIEALRVELNRLYDAYVKQHGALNKRGSSFLDEDVDFPLALALEDDKTALVEGVIEKGKNKGKKVVRRVVDWSKGRIFSERTLFPRQAPTSAASVEDGYHVSLNFRGRVDVDYIAELTGQDVESVKTGLISRGLAFENPTTGQIEPRWQYLSGNVKRKLRAAQAAVETNPAYAVNVTELEKVLPPAIPIQQISVRLGSTWVPPKVIERFLEEKLGVKATVSFTPQTGSWHVSVSGGQNGALNSTTHGIHGYGGHELVATSLNLKSATVTRTVTRVSETTGKSYEAEEKDPTKTLEAQEKQEGVKRLFVEWVKQTPSAATELERLYNEQYNGVVVPHFDPPTWEQYPNASADITLRDHQKRVVTRMLQNSTLLAHAVGTGKTYAMITAAMEQRRLGLARKPMIVVQNATLEQFARSFKRLYPTARILAPNARQRDAKQRNRTMSRIATGDWDAVIVPQSFINMLPDDPERERAYIRNEIKEMEAARIEAAAQDGKKSPKAADLQRAIDRLNDRLSNLAARKVDDVLTFEQLGVDSLFVDEAHAYKKLQFTTKMESIKGLDVSASKRGFSMMMKARWVQEKNQGRNVVFATGTPVSNTIAEAWTMMRYLRPDVLEDYDMEKFDSFAGTFGEAVTQLEMTAGGTWKPVTRFARYTNGPELIAAWRTVADVVTPEEINLPNLPALKNGKVESVVVKQSPSLKTYVMELRRRLEEFAAMSGKKKRDNSHIPLVVFGLAKKASLDMRMIDPSLPDEPEGKLNRAADNVLRIWQESADVQGTQMVFADSYQDNPDNPRFNLYDEMKRKLVARGIPEDQIAIITADIKDAKREVLFQKVNDGEIRVVIGSTERMGVGVNAQRKLVALHHLDAPPRPMDIEQRNGRIIRQGNENPVVEVLQYGVENTLDAAMFQKLATKQRFINQILRGDLQGRNFEDAANEQSLTFEEQMAAFSGDPLALERVTVDNQVRQLSSLQSGHYEQVRKGREELDYLTNQKIPTLKTELDAARKASMRFEQAFAGGDFTAQVGDTKATGRKEVVAALDAEIGARLKDMSAAAEAAIAGGKTYGGMVGPERTLTLNGQPVRYKATVWITETMVRDEKGRPLKDDSGNQVTKSVAEAPVVEWQFVGHGGTHRVTSGQGFLQGVPSELVNITKTTPENIAASLAKAERDQTELAGFVQQPFEREAELNKAKVRLAEIDDILAAKGKPAVGAEPWLVEVPKSPKPLLAQRNQIRRILDDMERLERESKEWDAPTINYSRELHGRLMDRLKTIDRELLETIAPTTDAAISIIEMLEGKLRDNLYSDPLLLTPLAKLALKLAKTLLQAGRTLEVAIREAIAQAKAQMPGEVVDEAQLAAAMREGLFAMAPEPAAQAAPYTGETKESKAMRLLTPIQYRSTTDAESEQLAKDFIDRVHGGDLREALRAARYPDPLSGIDERFAAFVGSEVMNRATEQGLANNDAALIKLGGEAKDFTQAILSKGAQATQAGNRIKNRSMASAAVLDLWARSVDLIDQELAKRFPDVTSHNIKSWLTEAGRQAVKEMAKTMTRTNAVTSRVLRIVGRDAGVDWATLFTSSAANQLQWQRDLFNRIREHPKLQNLSEAQAAELTNILTEAWQRERMKIFRREFRKQVILPEVKPSDAAKLEAAVPELIKQLNLGLLENEAFRNALAPRYGKQPVTLAEARELHAEAQAAQAKPVGLQREQAMRSVLDKMRVRSGIPRWEYVQGWWYASMLSGMGQQGRNILGNASVLADNMLASTARDIASGRPQATLARVGAMLRGMRENVTSGEFGAIFLEGKVSAREGMDIAQASNVLELAAKESSGWKRMLGSGRYVTRFMLAVDSFFYDAAAEVAAVNEIIARNKTATWPEVQQEIFDKLNLSPEKRAAAEAKAKAEGVTGRDFNRRVIEILEQDRPSEILDAQHRFALEATLNNEPQGLLGLIAKATLSARKAFPPLVAVVPFVPISANVGNLLLQHSPFGLYYTLANWSNQGQGWEGRRGGAWSGKLIGIRPDLTPEEYQQLRAKVFLSHAALVMLFAWAASESDEDEPLMQVTGSMQGINPDKRRQLEEQGIRPYSIKFGGRSFDYRQTPWAVAFATVGNWMDGQRYEDQWDEKAWLVKTANAAAGGKMVVLDQNFLSNLMVFLDRGPQLAKDQNASKLLAFAGRTVGGAVPAIGKEVESWFAPDVRKAVTSWDYVQREFPILRQSAGVPVVNVLGEPVQRPRYPLSWLTSEASEDPVWQALGEKAQKGVFVPVPSAAATILQNGKRVKMTPEQFAKYQSEVGKLYRAKLTRDLARFERMTPEQAAEYFKREFEPLREQARMRVR